ncbi:hypothetical protein Dimus_032326, partial [Dionaea muscipula]
MAEQASEALDQSHIAQDPIVNEVVDEIAQDAAADDDTVTPAHVAVNEVVMEEVVEIARTAAAA